MNSYNNGGKPPLRIFPEARQIVEQAMEEIIHGAKPVEQALTDAEKEITEKIQAYNKTVQ
ncbi:hypothetical protein [Thermobacillus sp. ZCTH02-B1]|mgnify:CR=1 FL=1|uniref:hypothetical protein n=1 Tax=Thermobacillus sp. ZCTH02-B1 TaxID=1858795 RepID=UPI0025F1AA94|nr:hypothetical protein [Thermobacillus sp. ZCTH02-B1]